MQLALLLILGGFGYGGWEYYDFTSTEVPRMEEELRTKGQQLQAKQAEYQRVRQFAQNIESVKREIRELNVQLEASLEHMPKTFNLAGLLRRLTLLAQNSGVEISTFKPAKAEEPVAGAFYSTINIEFDLKGSFTQSLLFFDQVSRLKRILNLQKVRMEAKENKNQGTNGAIAAETSVLLKTYRFTE